MAVDAAQAIDVVDALARADRSLEAATATIHLDPEAAVDEIFAARLLIATTMAAATASG